MLALFGRGARDGCWLLMARWRLRCSAWPLADRMAMCRRMRGCSACWSASELALLMWHGCAAVLGMPHTAALCSW